ncbi:MAG TPA: CDP-alcohol phosphatidyltransferase family protein [Anaerolineales bacterium]|nr:CDP-alcohol phosphatidyltransferase family protein [Anaerolineales bacterium]
MSENPPPKPSFTDWARKQGAFILEPAGRFFVRLGVPANAITIAGTLGNLVGAFFLAQGNFFVGGLLILVMSATDALDGATARAYGESNKWGAFVDSTSDRWQEAFTLMGLVWYYATVGNTWACGLIFLALTGSFMVSYTRARAEGLGIDCKVGILGRLERYLVLAPSLVLGYPLIGVAIIAVLGTFTALQRTWHVRTEWYKLHPKKK